MQCFIVRPFVCVYNYVKEKALGFYNCLAGKVHAVAGRIFTSFLLEYKDRVFQAEIQQLETAQHKLTEVQKEIEELKPHFAELSARLRNFSENLVHFPENLQKELKDLFPHLPTDPLQRPPVMEQVIKQGEEMQKTADRAAETFTRFFS